MHAVGQGVVEVQNAWGWANCGHVGWCSADHGPRPPAGVWDPLSYTSALQSRVPAMSLFRTTRTPTHLRVSVYYPVFQSHLTVLMPHPADCSISAGPVACSTLDPFFPKVVVVKTLSRCLVEPKTLAVTPPPATPRRAVEPPHPPSAHLTAPHQPRLMQTAWPHPALSCPALPT